jgi:hypothetical protein
MINGRIPGAPLSSGGGVSSASSKGRPFSQSEDVDPMSGLTNMVDAMLVLAVGLMMALVVALKVSLPDLQEILDEDLTQVDTPEEITDEIQSTENPYIELGRVYQDPITGKTYVLKEDSDEAVELDDSASSTSSTNTSAAE